MAEVEELGYGKYRVKIRQGKQVSVVTMKAANKRQAELAAERLAKQGKLKAGQSGSV